MLSSSFTVLYSRYAVAMQSLCSCYAVAMQSLCSCYAVAMQLLCSRYAVAMQLLCSRYAVAMQLHDLYRSELICKREFTSYIIVLTLSHNNFI